jgi:hypothetical protein
MSPELIFALKGIAAFVVSGLVMLYIAARFAPVGWKDGDGFHYGEQKHK